MYVTTTSRKPKSYKLIDRWLGKETIPKMAEDKNFCTWPLLVFKKSWTKQLNTQNKRQTNM